MTNLKPTKYDWYLLTGFSLALFAITLWLMLDGDESPSIRFAFAVSGYVCCFANSVSGLNRQIAHKARRVYEWIGRKKIYRWGIAMLLILCPIGYGINVLSGVRDFYREAHVRREIKREGSEILEYAANHSERFPSNTNKFAHYRNVLAPVTRNDAAQINFGMPFIRQEGLRDLYLPDISKPESVVVLYSRELPGREGRVIFFLDGHTTCIRSRSAFSQLLREQETLLAHATRAKAKRDGAKLKK